MSGFDSHADDQALEVEALEAIYPQEFTKLQDSPLSWKVHLVPNPDGGDNHVSVDFICNLPSDYPDVAPDVEIKVITGLTPSQRDQLVQLAKDLAAENLGIAMGYTIAEAIREWLAENNFAQKDGSMHAAMLKRMAQSDKAKQKVVEKERKEEAVRQEAEDESEEAIKRRRQADGTPVTPDTFQAWKAAFDMEMLSLKGPIKGALGHGQPTGKELFLTDLAGKDLEGEDDLDDEEDNEDQKDVAVNEDLFADDEELDFSEDDSDYVPES